MKEDIDKRYDSWLQLIFWCFYNDYEFLTCLLSDFDCYIFLKFFRNRVFNEPTIIFCLRVLNFSSIIISKRKFISVVLPKDFITDIRILTWKFQCNNLLIFTQVCEQQCWSKNFSANKLSIIYNIWIDIQNIINVNDLLLKLSLSCIVLILKLILLSKNSFWSTVFRFIEFRNKNLFIIIYILLFLIATSMSFNISCLDIFLVLILIFVFQCLHWFNRWFFAAFSGTKISSIFFFWNS